MRCCGNLNLVHINELVGKLVLFGAVLVKITEPIVNIK